MNFALQDAFYGWGGVYKNRKSPTYDELNDRNIPINMPYVSAQLLLENAMQTVYETPTRILRLQNVQSRTGLSRSTIYALIKKRRFPQNIALAPRCVGWLESEIEAWITSRIQASRNK